MHCHLLSTGSELGRYAEALRARGYGMYGLPFSKSPAFFRRFWRIVASGRYDVVHVHTERAAFWVELFARLSGAKRVVRTVHSTFSFDGSLRIVRGLQRRLAASLLGVRHVFISSSVEANERTRFSTRGQRIDNFVDEREARPAESPAQKAALRVRLGFPEGFLVVSVGRCIPVKRHALIVHALAQLHARGVEASYVHVGTGEEETAEQDLARQLGVEEYARFVGERDDVPDILAGCDAFVMPSEYEALPISLLEAAACGVACVVTDAPGVRDVIRANVTGIVVPFGATALGDALADLAGDAPKRDYLGAAARVDVLGRFGRKRWLDAHAALYGAQKDSTNP